MEICTFILTIKAVRKQCAAIQIFFLSNLSPSQTSLYAYKSKIMGWEPVKVDYPGISLSSYYYVNEK